MFIWNETPQGRGHRINTRLPKRSQIIWQSMRPQERYDCLTTSSAVVVQRCPRENFLVRPLRGAPSMLPMGGRDVVIIKMSWYANSIVLGMKTPRMYLGLQEQACGDAKGQLKVAVPGASRGLATQKYLASPSNCLRLCLTQQPLVRRLPGGDGIQQLPFR